MKNLIIEFLIIDLLGLITGILIGSKVLKMIVKISPSFVYNNSTVVLAIGVLLSIYFIYYIFLYYIKP